MKNTDTQKKVELKDYHFLLTYEVKGYVTTLAEDERKAYEFAWETTPLDSQIDIWETSILNVEEYEVSWVEGDE